MPDLGHTDELEFLKNIVDIIPSAIVIVDHEGVIRFINPETVKLFGFAEDELLGRSINVMIPERFRANHPQYRESYYRDPRPRAMGAGRELYGLRKGDIEFPIEIGLRPMKVAGTSWVLASIIDITERRKVEDHYRLIVEHSRDAIYSEDLDGNILSWNKGAEEMFGYSFEEVHNKNANELIFAKNRRDVGENLLQEVRTDKTVDHYETVCQTAKGESIDVSISVAPIKNQEQNVIGAVQIARDVSHYRHEVLLQEIHHRIKNNLSIISSLIDMEQRRLEDPREDFVKILQNTNNRIHSIAKLHEKLYSSEVFNRIDLKDYFESLAYDLIQQENFRPKITVEMNEAKSPRLKIEEAIPCGLVWVEFLTNSLKYAFPSEQQKQQAEIKVGIFYDESKQIKVRFNDNGPGFIVDEKFGKNNSLGLKIIDLLSKQLGAPPNWRSAQGAQLEINFRYN